MSSLFLFPSILICFLYFLLLFCHCPPASVFPYSVCSIYLHTALRWSGCKDLQARLSLARTGTVNNVHPAQNFYQTARCPIASVNSLPNIYHSHKIIGEYYTFFDSSQATNLGTTSWLSSVALKLFSDWPRSLPVHNCY